MQPAAQHGKDGAKLMRQNFSRRSKGLHAAQPPQDEVPPRAGAQQLQPSPAPLARLAAAQADPAAGNPVLLKKHQIRSLRLLLSWPGLFTLPWSIGGWCSMFCPVSGWLLSVLWPSEGASSGYVQKCKMCIKKFCQTNRKKQKNHSCLLPLTFKPPERSSKHPVFILLR